MRIFKTYFLSYFQMAYSITHYGYHVIYHVPMTYLKTGSLYLLSTFIHFTTTPYLLQPPICSLDLWIPSFPFLKNSTYKWDHTVFVCLCQIISLGIMPSRSIHVVANGKISFSFSWLNYIPLQVFSSVTQSCLTLRPHGLQHARPPCPSPTPGAYSNSCPLSRWCHPTISSSVVSFSSHLQSFPASGPFPMS